MAKKIVIIGGAAGGGNCRFTAAPDCIEKLAQIILFVRGPLSV